MAGKYSAGTLQLDISAKPYKANWNTDTGVRYTIFAQNESSFFEELAAFFKDNEGHSVDAVSGGYGDSETTGILWAKS